MPFSVLEQLSPKDPDSYKPLNINDQSSVNDTISLSNFTGEDYLLFRTGELNVETSNRS